MAVDKGNTANIHLEDFDLVLLTACDIHGVARGRFIFKRSVQGFVRNGLGMTQGELIVMSACTIEAGVKILLLYQRRSQIRLNEDNQ